jgi:hypothetical protein
MTVSQLNPTLVARTVLLDGSVSGLRKIDSLGSILRVSAAPFSELDRMKASVCSPYIAYVIDTPLVYAGYGRTTRNIGDRVEEQLHPASQVYIIDANDSRFAKYEAAYIEARLIETGAELGVPLANRVRPFGRDGLAISPDHEQLVVHARVLLSVAGFGRFDEAQQTLSDPSNRVPATGSLHDVRVLDPETMTIPSDAVRMQLIWGDIQAEGFTVDDRFYLLPGADYFHADKSGLSEDKRRNASFGSLGSLGRGLLRVLEEHVGGVLFLELLDESPNPDLGVIDLTQGLIGLPLCIGDADLAAMPDIFNHPVRQLLGRDPEVQAEDACLVLQRLRQLVSHRFEKIALLINLPHRSSDVGMRAPADCIPHQPDRRLDPARLHFFHSLPHFFDHHSLRNVT